MKPIKYVNIEHNGERWNGFPQDQRQDRMSDLTTSIQHCTGNSNQATEARK